MSVCMNVYVNNYKLQIVIIKKEEDIFHFICRWYELPPIETPDHTLYVSSPSERGWPQLPGV